MASSTKLLIAESKGFSGKALQNLQRFFDVDCADLDRHALLKRVAAYDLLWVRLRSRIDAEIFDAAANLKGVITATTGLTHIDLDDAHARGIEILSLKGETDFLRDIRATAELTIALTLALIRKLPGAMESVQHGEWERDRFVGTELYQKTVGIIGYGRLGSLVARNFTAFGAQVVVNSRDLVPGQTIDGHKCLTLSKLLGVSDIVSLHVNYEPENHHLLSARHFDLMKQGGYFINTSRGELIDEQSLIGALWAGRLAGAAVDVVANEVSGSLSESPLLAFGREHPNLIITPHIGGATFESLSKTEIFLAQKAIERFATAAIRN